ncbi:MAG TPA: hypothetical protein VIG24_18435 [Acidimicrobiia bacterium]
MAGYREFQTGEVLTAANVDDFLAKQATMVFDDAGARDTALGTAVAGGNAIREGMLCYLNDTDELLKYDGSEWLEVGAGGLVAVKSATFTGTQTASVTAGSNVAVSDLSITHEVADAANRLIISAFIGAAGSSFGRAQVGLAVDDGTGLIAIGDAAASRSRVTAGGRVAGSTDSEVVAMPSVTFVHTPGAGSKTYTVRAINIRSVTETLYINRSASDGAFADLPRAVSSLVIQEVKV